LRLCLCQFYTLLIALGAIYTTEIIKHLVVLLNFSTLKDGKPTKAFIPCCLSCRNYHLNQKEKLVKNGKADTNYELLRFIWFLGNQNTQPESKERKEITIKNLNLYHLKGQRLSSFCSPVHTKWYLTLCIEVTFCCILIW